MSIAAAFAAASSSKDSDRDVSSSDVQPPPSPSSSISGSELSYASDTETEGNVTDSITTPPTSPHRPQTSFDNTKSTKLTSSSQQQDTLLDSKKAPSMFITPTTSSIEGLFGKIDLSHSQDSESLPAATPTKQSPPVSLGPSMMSPPNPRRPPLPQSLSAKRSRQVPGTIDLSNLPQFPSHPPLQVLGNITPQASSENSGSTPRAYPDRPGLFSRWSTDSEGDSDADSSYTGSDHCNEDSGHGRSGEYDFDENEEAAAQADGGVASTSAETKQRRSRKSRSSGGSPFLAPLPGLSNGHLGPILSPVAFSSPSLLPPAPKPHQGGFSPYASPHAEQPSFGFDSSSPSTSSMPVMRLSPASPTAFLRRQRRSRSKQGRKQASAPRDDGYHESSNDCADSTGSDGSPPSHPSGRLTRSQGLRIRDQGDKPRGRYARSLSLQLQQSASNPSSPMKTANALLGGTISPAETTQDPLRVKLREMPGAKTPEVSSPPVISVRPPTTRKNSRPTLHQLRTNSQSSVRTSSPLHLTSYPGEGNTTIAKDTTTNLFNTAFSFANRESPRGSPLQMRSPREPMPAIDEGKDSNPYFAGYV